MASQLVTLGVQSGDSDASETTRPHFLKLRKLLGQFCKIPYSPEIDEFAIVLRIAGKIWSFEGEGCQKLRWNRKDRFVSIDIVMPLERWQGVGDHEIKKFLVENVGRALSLMVEKLEKAKIVVESERLQVDYQQAIACFLSDEPED